MSTTAELSAITEALQRRLLTLFIGADLPSAVTGLASRADLARDLARRAGLDETLSLAEVAQRVSQAGNRFTFTNFLRQALNMPGKAPQPFHRRIVELVTAHHIETVITSAYDSLLASAFQAAGVGCNEVLRGSDLSYINPDWPTVIWLYGKAEQVDTLVVTDRDHSDLLRDRNKEALLDEVRRAFRRNTVLFLGYNLADPDFRFLFDQIAESRFARLAYAVWPGLPEVDVRMWRDRGIVILEEDPLGLLGPSTAPDVAGPRGEPTTTFPLPSATIGREAVDYTPPPAAQKPAPTQPPTAQAGWVSFKLQVARQTDLAFDVRALQTPMGEPHATGRLPCDDADLTAVLQALESSSLDTADYTTDQIRALERLGLVRAGRLAADYLQRLGARLHEALLPGDVGVAFRMAINQARQERTAVSLQLRFDADAAGLARYPWELLHDGQRHLISAGAVELSRYIAYGEAAPSLPVHPPARLLFIESRPRDLPALTAESERQAVWHALQPLADTGRITLERLEPPTYDALLDTGASYHLIHFDGHGLYARRCPRCRAINSASATTCSACRTPLADVPPQGYLAFEGKAGKADFVGADDMENLLLHSQVRLMFLSACQSGVVGGHSLFGGVGPGLIRAGVPAVVAMQFSVPVQSTVSFAESFYTALARGETVPHAVAQGRRRLFRNGDWYIPTLYLRSRDDEGRIFVA